MESLDRQVLTASPNISLSIRESKGRRRVYCAAFLATLSIFLAIAESIIPRPLPWMRLGLANAITLYAFSVMKPKEVLFVVVGRVVATSLLLGTFLSMGFLLSITGALSSFVVMLLLHRLCGRWLSLVGISILGAVSSNAAQLLVVNAVFIGSRLSYYLLPFLFLFALIGGVVSGLFGQFLTDNL